MKRLLLSIVSAVCMFTCFALDTIHLNNGRVVTGTITQIEEGVSITIMMENGREYTYPLIEVKSYDKGDIANVPIVKAANGYRDYNFYDRGFWASVEVEGGYLLSKNNDAGYCEQHFIGGYRLNEYLKAGIGFGARYYINNKVMRCKSYKWSFPLFLNVRGNIIPELNRSIVPYYSADFGAAINDGFFVRPAIGVRFGEPRSSFTLAITYMAQKLKLTPEQYSTTSFIGLKAGWEF